MLPASPRPAGRPRGRGLLLLVVLLAVLAVTAGLTPGLTAPGTAASTGSQLRTAEEPPPAKVPGPGDDFARLPERCYAQDERYTVISPCQVTTYAKRPYLVAWGDSHVLQYLPALQSLAVEHRVNLVVLHAAGCPVSKPFPESSGEGRIYCDGANERAIAHIKRLSAQVARVHVLVAGYYSGYRANYAVMQRAARAGRPSGLTEYVEHMAKLAVLRSKPAAAQLAGLHRPVTFVAQAATIPADARRCPRGEDPYQCDLPRHRALPDEQGNQRFVQTHFLDRIPSSRLVRPSRLYCDATVCRAHVQGVDTFWDYYHLGARAALRTRPYFRATFQALAPR